ncbi:hypothetical protein [Lysinibacillus fusiformis]|uniref:hypothetical protein n=1 Tax=Lysinibacillus fusiformis TaxID=28031 RepID=UPI0021E665BA|nr:hypothetical protein [Lysinibacillus fusiformis]
MIFDKTFIKPENRDIGMVFQNYALFSHMTVGKNILFGITDLTEEDCRKRLKEVLELVKWRNMKIDASSVKWRSATTYRNCKSACH